MRRPQEPVDPAAARVNDTAAVVDESEGHRHRGRHEIGDRHYHRPIPFRGILMLILGAAYFACSMAGILTPIVVVDNGSAKLETDLWKVCSVADLGSGLTRTRCRDTNDALDECQLRRVNVLRAFGIVCAVFSFFLMIPMIIMDLMDGLPRHRAKGYLLAVGAFAFVISLIFWAVVVGMWYNGCSDEAAFKDVRGSRYGPSGPLFIAAWALSVLWMATALLVRPVHERVDKMRRRYEASQSRSLEEVPVSANTSTANEYDGEVRRREAVPPPGEEPAVVTSRR